MLIDKSVKVAASLSKFVILYDFLFLKLHNNQAALNAECQFCM